MKDWEWFGEAGHACCAHDCLFHMHTHVNGYCVSTVGDYRVRVKNRPAEEPEDVGFNRLYETMVFQIEKDGKVGLQELEVSPYNSSIAASLGHIDMCYKYELML